MCFSTDEIHDLMAETIEQLTIASGCRSKPHPHLDEGDDDYDFVNANLERCADRRDRLCLTESSSHVRLEREADRLLGLN